MSAGGDRHSTAVPGVFLSHASEDKDRFARRFAERLKDAGCRVWFDEWEMLPGDSLVDKVFEEGLKDADAMVVVLSKHSVDKPWVREELNAGVIKRIEGSCKLIPVVLDHVEVPGALLSTVWQSIADVQNYDSELDRILRAIHDDRNRLAIGDRPIYAQTPALPGLYSTDTLLLRVAGDLVLESDGTLVHSQQLLPRLQDQGMTTEAYLDSLDVLEERGLVNVHRTLGSGVEAASSLSVSITGLELYGQSFVEEYDALVTKVAEELVNTEHRSDREISEETGVQRVVVEHVFDVFASRGLVKVSKMTGPVAHVFSVSPQLGRMLAEGM